MGDVKLVVFNNGLQIIGVYESKDIEKNSINLIKPVQLMMVPNSQPGAKEGQVGMAFAPFLQYTEEWSTGVPFVIADVLTVVTPMRELLNSYNTSFGSGLVLAGGLV